MANVARKYNSTLVNEPRCECDQSQLRYIGMTQNEEGAVKLFMCPYHKKVRRVQLTPEEQRRNEQGLRIRTQ